MQYGLFTHFQKTVTLEGAALVVSNLLLPKARHLHSEYLLWLRSRTRLFI